MSAFPGWESQVLRAIGAPVTKENVAFLDVWQRLEGGNASFNPLNTTTGAAGATNYNSVGVKNFVSAQQGAAATAQTLQNGRYNTLLAALRSGKLSSALTTNKIQIANEISTWGTKTLANDVRNSGPGVLSGSPASSVGGAVTSIPGVQQTLDAGGAVVDAGQAVGGFLGTITSVDFLLRAGQVVGGAALVAMGSFLLAKQIGLAEPVGGAVGAAVAGPAGAVAGSSIGRKPQPKGDGFDDAELAGWESAARADARRQGRERYVSERKAAKSPGLNDDAKYDQGVPY